MCQVEATKSHCHLTEGYNQVSLSKAGAWILWALINILKILDANVFYMLE